MALGTRHPVLRTLVLVLVTAVAIDAGNRFAEVGDSWPYAALCIAQVLWLLASLGVFRMAGYQIVRPAPARFKPRLSSTDV